jgi:hypothetical protein
VGETGRQVRVLEHFFVLPFSLFPFGGILACKPILYLCPFVCHILFPSLYGRFPFGLTGLSHLFLIFLPHQEFHFFSFCLFICAQPLLRIDVFLA